MKLLVFAHKPPPHHGQSYMVQLLIEALGGDQRQNRKQRGMDEPSRVEEGKEHPIQCYHVDSRLSDDLQDIGRIRWGKMLRLVWYCLEAIWCRFRYGVTCMYYVPAPGLRSAIYRDWIVMACCRPFFRTLVLHWHAVGLGGWLETDARPFERWITRRLIGHSSLSIVLGPFYEADAAKLAPKRLEAIPNGIPDPCPRFDREVLPGRLARGIVRAKLLAGQVASKEEADAAGANPEVFRVLYLSLCTREKGLFDTLEAVALTNRKLAGLGSPLRVELAVAGKFWKPQDEVDFQQRISQPDLNDPASSVNKAPVVRFHGFVAGKEKDRLFRESDCFCFPTYYPMEGHPVSLLEAMAYGLPVITTRWRAIPELFPAGYQGLVEPRSPEQLATIIELFTRENHSAPFRRTFLENYREVRFAERITRALRSTDGI